MGFELVTKLEDKVASFFGAPYAIATDSCTHAVELCLRYEDPYEVTFPTHTYPSIPFLEIVDTQAIGLGISIR